MLSCRRLPELIVAAISRSLACLLSRLSASCVSEARERVCALARVRTVAAAAAAGASSAARLEVSLRGSLATPTRVPSLHLSASAVVGSVLLFQSKSGYLSLSSFSHPSLAT